MNYEEYINALDSDEELEPGMLKDLDEAAPEGLHGFIMEAIDKETSIGVKKRINYRIFGGVAAAAILLFISTNMPNLLNQTKSINQELTNTPIMQYKMEDSSVAVKKSVDTENLGAESNKTDRNITADAVLEAKEASKTQDENTSKQVNAPKVAQDAKGKAKILVKPKSEVKEDKEEANNMMVAEADENVKTMIKGTADTLPPESLDMNKEANSIPQESDNLGIYGMAEDVINYELSIEGKSIDIIDFINKNGENIKENIYKFTSKVFEQFKKLLEENGLELKLINEYDSNDVFVKVIEKQP